MKLKKKYSILLVVIFYMNGALVSLFVGASLLFLLKALVWGFSLGGMDYSSMENGLEPFSMLDLGEKYHGNAIYQIWLDELSKPKEEKTKTSVDETQGYLSDEAFPYLTYQSNPKEMDEYFDRVIKAYYSSATEQDLEQKIEKELENYLKSSFVDKKKDKIELENFAGLIQLGKGNKWTEEEEISIPDVDLEELFKLKELIEKKGSYLMRMDLEHLEWSKEEREAFLNNKLRSILMYPNSLEKINYYTRVLEESARYLYNREKDAEFRFKRRFSPLMVLYMPDGPTRSRDGRFYIKEEYERTFPNFPEVESPRVYVRYNVPRLVSPFFHEHYRWSWLDRNMVHTSNYVEPLYDYQNKLKYRVLDYYLSRAERKYFYQILQSLPDMYRFNEKSKFRRGNRPKRQEKREREEEILGESLVTRRPMKIGRRLKNKRHRKDRRLTWLRRIKRYNLANYSSDMKIKRLYRYMERKRPEHIEKDTYFPSIVVGYRRWYRKKKLGLQERGINPKLAPAVSAYPRFYINDLTRGRLLNRDRQFILPGDGTEFPIEAYKRLRLSFYMLHAEFLRRDKRYDRYSAYEKWLFRKCCDIRGMSNTFWNARYPVMWPAYKSAYGLSSYYTKDYYPVPFWFHSAGSLQRLRYDPSFIPSKSLRRDWWTGRLYKEIPNFRHKRSLNYGKENFIKSWVPGTDFFREFQRTMWLGKSRQLSNRLQNRIRHFWLVGSEDSDSESYSYEYRVPKKRWFTGFSVPAYNKLSLYWIISYAVKGLWLETYFSSYLAILGSTLVYWLAMWCKTLLVSLALWVFWVLLLIGTLGFVLYLIRSKEKILQKKDFKLDMREEEFVYWYFKTNYRYEDLDWSAISKNWRFSNFYIFDKMYYNIYGKSLFSFLQMYEEDFDLFYKALVRFLFGVFLINLLIGLLTLYVIRIVIPMGVV